MRFWARQAVGDRHSGPIILNTHGEQMTRGSAAWVVAKLARRAKIAHHVHLVAGAA